MMVLGHTKCGAVKGAIAKAKLEHLTGLLEIITPAVRKTNYLGKREADNYDFVDAVARTNVTLTLNEIREKSKTLSELEKQRAIKLIGAMYDISTGKIDFISQLSE